MRFYILIFALIVAFASEAKDPKVAGIRNTFYALTLDSENTAEKLEELRQIKERNGLMTAYEAAMEALMAKVAWNPLSKIGHVKKSQEIFDKAIEMDPRNVEIRFLRFSVEWHIPRWLGYSKNLQSDKDFIMNRYTEFDTSCLSQDMLNFINRFLNDSGWFSKSELALVYEATKK
ncbi:MAG: hypothetical protein AAF487_07635 [Bacteroidota bacterium]